MNTSGGTNTGSDIVLVKPRNERSWTALRATIDWVLKKKRFSAEELRRSLKQRDIIIPKDTLQKWIRRVQRNPNQYSTLLQEHDPPSPSPSPSPPSTLDQAVSNLRCFSGENGYTEAVSEIANEAFGRPNIHLETTFDVIDALRTMTLVDDSNNSRNGTMTAPLRLSSAVSESTKVRSTAKLLDTSPTTIIRAKHERQNLSTLNVRDLNCMCDTCMAASGTDLPYINCESANVGSWTKHFTQRNSSQKKATAAEKGKQVAISTVGKCFYAEDGKTIIHTEGHKRKSSKACSFYMN